VFFIKWMIKHWDDGKN